MAASRGPSQLKQRRRRAPFVGRACRDLATCVCVVPPFVGRTCRDLVTCVCVVPPSVGRACRDLVTCVCVVPRFVGRACRDPVTCVCVVPPSVGRACRDPVTCVCVVPPFVGRACRDLVTCVCVVPRSLVELVETWRRACVSARRGSSLSRPGDVRVHAAGAQASLPRVARVTLDGAFDVTCGDLRRSVLS
jgi:hypothetical protein